MFKTIKNAINNTIDATIINAFTIVSRYFVTLDPVLNSHYEMAQPITFSGDFEVEVEFSKGPQAEIYNVLIGQSDATSFWIATRDDYVNVNVLENRITGTIPVLDGKLHLIKITRVGSLVSLYVDGVLDGTVNGLGTFSFDQIGCNSFGLYFDGIIANAKFTDKSGASDVVTTFKLDNSPAAENYTYGSEKVVNGDFANGTANWSLDAGWSIANSKATSDGSNYTYIKQDGGLTLGSNISITFEIKDYISGSVRFNNSVDPVSQNLSGNGYHTILASNLLSPNLRFQAALFDGSIDNVSVKEITNYTEANAASEIEYSQENVFGSEKVVNGDFATDLSGWTVTSSAGWTWDNGSARLNGDGSLQPFYQNSLFEIGKSYEITVHVSNLVGNLVTILGGTGNTSLVSGTNTIIFTALGVGLEFKRGGGVTSVNIDNVSVKEITNGVTYKNIPQSARELYTLDGTTWTGSNELVVNGDFATDSDWDLGTGWTISNDKMNSSGSNSNAFSQNGIFEQGRTYIISFEIITSIQGSIRLYYNSPLTGFYTANSVGVHTVTVTVLGTYGALYFFNNPETDLFIGSIDNVSVKEIIEVAS